MAPTIGPGCPAGNTGIHDPGRRQGGTCPPRGSPGPSAPGDPAPTVARGGDFNQVAAFRAQHEVPALDGDDAGAGGTAPGARRSAEGPPIGQPVQGGVRPVAAHHIGRGEMEVVVHHGQGRVAQNALQRQHVAAGAEVGHAEGVAKAMRVDVRHVGPRRQALEHAPQGVARQRSPLARQKRPIRVGVRVVRPGARQLQIPIHHGPRTLAQRHRAVAGAFAPAHPHLAGGQVQVRHAQAAELGGAEPGIEQHAEDGQVAQPRGRARIAGVQQALLVVRGDGLDLARRQPPRSKPLQRMHAGVARIGQPAGKRPQHAAIAVDRVRGPALALVARRASRARHRGRAQMALPAPGQLEGQVPHIARRLAVGVVREAAQHRAFPAQRGARLALGLAGRQVFRDGLSQRRAGPNRHVTHDPASRVGGALQAAADRWPDVGKRGGACGRRSMSRVRLVPLVPTLEKLVTRRLPRRGGGRCRPRAVPSGLTGAAVIDRQPGFPVNVVPTRTKLQRCFFSQLSHHRAKPQPLHGQADSSGCGYGRGTNP